MYFTRSIRRLKFHKTYIFYSFAYGLSTLIIPLSSQFLVNNLALAGIWANTISFLTIIGVILGLAQIFKHTQVILVEYLQREIVVYEMMKWRNLKDSGHSHYYFEIFNLLKSFSKSYANIIDMGLVTVFGMSTIVIFHPAFLVLPIVTGITMYFIRRVFHPAYKTSIDESNVKYEIYDQLTQGVSPNHQTIYNYLGVRDHHFKFIRGISFKMTILYAFSLFYVLAIGAYLIEQDQLSVGQLVAAELIVSGIMQSLMKLPNSLEALYDYETSHFKIEKALRGTVEDH
jgi:hypothetical protein